MSVFQVRVCVRVHTYMCVCNTTAGAGPYPPPRSRLSLTLLFFLYALKTAQGVALWAPQDATPVLHESLMFRDGSTSTVERLVGE